MGVLKDAPFIRFHKYKNEASGILTYRMAAFSLAKPKLNSQQ